MTYIVLKAPLNSNQPTNRLKLSSLPAVVTVVPDIVFKTTS